MKKYILTISMILVLNVCFLCNAKDQIKDAPKLNGTKTQTTKTVERFSQPYPTKCDLYWLIKDVLKLEIYLEQPECEKKYF